MNYVVAPLSFARRSIYPVETLPINAFWHIVLVGLSTAWFVTRALKVEQLLHNASREHEPEWVALEFLFHFAPANQAQCMGLTPMSG